MNKATQDGLDPTRWRTLFVAASAQLMIVLDSSIMNIAIPSAKLELGISDANQHWVITAYTLAFGSLLLLGGRIGDYMGRRKIFLIGLIGSRDQSGVIKIVVATSDKINSVPRVFSAFSRMCKGYINLVQKSRNPAPT